jgi:hypothetical protein
LRPSESRGGRQRGSAGCQTQKSTAGKFHRRPSISRRLIRSPRRRWRAAQAGFRGRASLRS